MEKLSKIIWGVVLIAVGLILGLNALEVTDIDIFFDGWWTLFIIIPCFADLFKDHDFTGNIIGIVIGAFLLLCCQDVLNFDMVWKLLFPSILVIIGLSFIFKDIFTSKIRAEMKKINKNNPDKKEYAATFSSQKLDFKKETFTGAELSAVFGGIECDLTEAIIKEDVVINVNAVFGGVDIVVPSDVNVKVSSSSIFGGVDKKHIKDAKEKAKTIYVNASCVFGGVDIK